MLDPKNTLNWKHGGFNQVNYVKYNINPTQNQNYIPGVCTFHLQEDESWTGNDQLDSHRTWYFSIEKATMKDGIGGPIGSVGLDQPVPAGAGNPLIWNTTLPNPLVITPESQNGDYIQFAFAAQSWTTQVQTGIPNCNVGALNSEYSPDVSFTFIHFAPFGI